METDIGLRHSVKVTSLTTIVPASIPAIILTLYVKQHDENGLYITACIPDWHKAGRQMAGSKWSFDHCNCSS